LKAFLMSVAAAIVIALAAAVVLNGADMSSQAVFQSGNQTTRL